ncbi:cation:dicarboxylate symporter family transporter [Cupriavidus basilensis]
MVDFLLKLIPSTVMGAFASGDVLQGAAGVDPVRLRADRWWASAAGRWCRADRHLLARLFKMMGFIIKLAPLGVLGAVAFTVGKYGIGSLKQLGYLVVVFYGAVMLFVLVVLGTVMRLCGFSVIKLIRYLRAELLVVLGTASSDSVLPQIMKKLEFMGIKKSVVGLVIPTGYSFNLDAFSIYLTLAAVFIAAGHKYAAGAGRPAGHPGGGAGSRPRARTAFPAQPS